MTPRTEPWTSLTGLSEHDFARIQTLVRERAAIVLEADRLPLVEARLVALSRRERMASVQELFTELEAEHFAGPWARKVVEAMTTHETAFFRDFHPFEALRTAIIPSLLEAVGNARPLRVWCGASSTGQEPFSVAMLLHHHFPEVEARITATDVSNSVLTRCREGRYSCLEVNRGLPARMLVHYFGEAGIDWQLDGAVQSMVAPEPINLAGDWPDWPPFDLVLLRHVLIYFDPPTRQAVLRRVHGQMTPGGCLLLGAGEAPAGLEDCFHEERSERCVWYRAMGPATGESA